MKDRLLKNQIITGIPNITLQEKLLQERNLDLDKYIDMCRGSESAASQVKDISTTKTEINKIGFRKSPKSANEPPRHHTGNGDETKAAKRRCKFCGRWHQFSPGTCPARGKTCNKCGKTGHCTAKCGSRAVHQVEADSDVDDSHPRGRSIGSVTLHQINTVDSMGGAKMRVHDKFVNFLLDPGANANLISTHDADPDKLQVMPPGRVLTMSNGATQKTLGQTRIAVYNPECHQMHELIFDVVPVKLRPILGFHAVRRHAPGHPAPRPFGVCGQCTAETTLETRRRWFIPSLSGLQEHATSGSWHVTRPGPHEQVYPDSHFVARCRTVPGWGAGLQQPTTSTTTGQAASWSVSGRAPTTQSWNQGLVHRMAWQQSHVVPRPLCPTWQQGQVVPDNDCRPQTV